MSNFLKTVRTTVFICGMLIFMTQKAVIPVPLLLQKSLLVATYGYGLFSLGQHYKWFPKNMLLTNRATDKTEKDIEKNEATAKAELIELLSNMQKEAFFKQIYTCKQYNTPTFAKNAEQHSLALRSLALSWSSTVHRPLGAFRL